MADGKVVIDIEADSSDFKDDLKDVNTAAKKGSGELDDLEKSAKDAGDGMEDLGDAAEEASGGIGAADVAVGTFVANGLTALISAVGNAVSGLFGLADETRELRTNMAKLETGFTTAGHSAESAATTYSELYAILGDDGQATEAAAHLAQLTTTQEELATWTDIATGVYATFGDSLPIESLTEAA